MRAIAIKVILALTLSSVPLLGGCMRMNSAVQIGGPESSTWVYVAVNNERRNGVFRCDVIEGNPRPVCVRAEMRY